MTRRSRPAHDLRVDHRVLRHVDDGSPRISASRRGDARRQSAHDARSALFGPFSEMWSLDETILCLAKLPSCTSIWQRPQVARPTAHALDIDAEERAASRTAVPTAKRPRFARRHEQDERVADFSVHVQERLGKLSSPLNGSLHDRAQYRIFRRPCMSELLCRRSSRLHHGAHHQGAMAQEPANISRRASPARSSARSSPHILADFDDDFIVAAWSASPALGGDAAVRHCVGVV